VYHYRVSADGRIWRTQPETLLTWHAHAANHGGLAICCDLGPGQRPTEKQLEGLKELLDWLCYHRPDIPAGRKEVYGHGELKRDGNRTVCPGLLRKWVQAYRKGCEAEEPAA
jgi:N-acetyl-anhydromuramyl-L-alanine amidase AmpD